MEKIIKPKKNSEPLQVLLIGNNPIDLGKTLEKIHQIRGRRVITEIAFDLRSIIERLMNFNPNFILIDDNIGKAELAQTIDLLTHRRKTRHIPITVIKNSNYQESAPAGGALDYLLKQNFSTDSLYRTIANSLKLRRTQQFLINAFKKRKGFRLAF